VTPVPLDRLYLITDPARAAHSVTHVVAEACVAGLRMIQFRDKRLGDRAYAARARALVAVAESHDARLLLNGHTRLVSAVRATGAHLPSAQSVLDARAHLGETALLGYSAHNRDELAAAAAQGANFVTLSPVFPTDSKSGAPSLGLESFADMASACPVPVYALGGVTAENAPACRDAGAYGVAVSGAIMAAPDPARATSHLLEAAR